MNALRTLAFFAAVIASTSGYCYDAQVAADQFYDDSFVCNDNIPYPEQLIENDLQNTQDLDVLYFLDTATSCFNETNYFSKSYAAPGDYAYQCVCPSPRKRIEKVYLNNNQDICFVVRPFKQDIQYAQCGGHCSFDYGTKIATASRGYFCAYQSYVRREFLVWCPTIPHTADVTSPRHQHAQQGPFGIFKRVIKTLPTLCSCRGYFCDNHLATAGAGVSVIH